MKNNAIRFLEAALRGVKDRLWYRKYVRQYKDYNRMHGIPETPAEGEDEYVRLWSRLSPRVDCHSFRLFCHFCGRTPYIVPEDIGHRKMEPILNPLKYRRYYEDKNLYSQYINPDVMPRTIMRRIGGGSLLGADYKPFTPPCICVESERVILKPSADSCSGQGIRLFVRKGDGMVSADDGTPLTEDFLMNYGSDFIIQEALSQHPFMAQFCHSAVNTLRLAVYRSVADERVHVTGAIMRIGREGSHVDNAHAGGCFVGINIETGEMGHRLYDQYGKSVTVWNDIDFEKSDFKVPQWGKVLDLARYIGSCHHHMRLLALDIAIRDDGRPMFIEANVNDFSYWLFMFTGHSPFGQLTDEIVNHCVSHSQNLEFDFFKNI